MRGWLKRAVMAACLGVLSLPFAGISYAASLGKIEVTSHLGEPFYAEVPLQLDADELVSRVLVQVASKSDYKIFEVYRDPVLDSIHADMASDKRGARVQLSSRTAIKAPFFNLILKIRTGRVSSFRKYPIFLDVGKAVLAAANGKPQPTVAAASNSNNVPAVKPATSSFAQAPVLSTLDAAGPKTANWARAGIYGPIVRGDTLSTIANRLSVDHRYTHSQIMVALFDKNQGSFEQQNMNLLKAGSMLKVPSAAEVEMHSKHEALRIQAGQEKAWKKLKRQTRYAASAEMQRNRYSPRISVGKMAYGVATASVEKQPTTQAQDAATAGKLASEPVASTPTTPVVNKQSQSGASQTLSAPEAGVLPAASNPLLVSMQEKNDRMQQQLNQNNQRMKALQDKVDSLAIEASMARIGKLEILVARLQKQLQKGRQSSAELTPPTVGWIVWLLIALVLVLIAVVVVLLRREPHHPGASANNSHSQPDDALAKPTVESSASEALISTIEHEVFDIEEDAARSSDHLTTDNLADVLNDADTAELEPIAASTQTLDTEIDYVSEADVYIRYGMNEEALQQLEMALRLQPDNAEAHIKKAKVLLAMDDKKGFDETIAVATMALTTTDLARFRTSVTDLGGVVDEQAPLTAGEEPIAEEAGRETLRLDQLLGEFDKDDDLIRFDDDNARSASAFATSATDHPLADLATDIDHGATQELDSLLGEFTDDEIDVIDIDADHGATSVRGHLLDEFTELDKGKKKP